MGGQGGGDSDSIPVMTGGGGDADCGGGCDHHKGEFLTWTLGWSPGVPGACAHPDRDQAHPHAARYGEGRRMMIV
jgi:hypothetical protein